MWAESRCHILHKDLTTYSLISSMERVLLENPTGSQLVKIFPAFYGARRFITAFTRVRNLSISWASSNQSLPPHPTSWRSILINIILPSTPGSSKWTLSEASPPPQKKPAYASPLPHTSYMTCPPHSSRFYYPKNICWAVQIISSLLCSSPLPCYIVFITPEYSQQPILNYSHM